MSVIRTALAAAILLGAAQAQAGTFLSVCGPGACTAADGTTQPAGTALNRLLWDGKTPFTPGDGQTLIPDDGRALYAPPAKAPTTIAALGFMSRFAKSEQQVIQKAAAADWQIQFWMTQVAAAGVVDVTSATVTQGIAALVSGGLLTSGRATQILNLAVASP